MSYEEKKRRADFNSFVTKEYSTIADAHFNVSQRITSFFQYMLAIYAAPLILFNTAIEIDETTKGLVFVFISVIGFFICMYANQLRCESLLYSRTVNAARLYNFDKTKNTALEKYQVLPIQKEKPSFKDNYQFIWIVFTAAAVNAGYFIYGIVLLKGVFKIFVIECFKAKWNMGINNINDYVETLFFIFIFIIYFAFQHMILNLFTKRVEAGLNFYKQRIGIDIDGVIGNHEQMFCNIYNEIKDQKKPTISSEQIKKIPVNKVEGLCVDEKDERRIFSLPKYWTQMPLMDKAVQIMQKIHNTFGFEIYIFSWRDWGRKIDEFCSEKFDIRKITENWLKENGILRDNLYNRIREKHTQTLIAKEWKKTYTCPEPEKQKHKDKIKELGKLKCIYKKLYLEKGNYNLPAGIKGALYKNRFYYSSRWKIKYFIEDEPIKANKLAAVCKYVFLIDHLYNRDEKDLPFNVIKVRDWVEIYDKIKELN